MEIVRFEAKHVRDVTRLVNMQIRFVPPYWQLSEDQVWAILQKESLWEIHYVDEEAPAWTWQNEICCIVEDQHVLVAARFDYRYDDGQLTMVSARWLVNDPNNPTALHLLLDHLVAKRGDSKASILINGRSDFGIGWSGIPTTAEHLNIALWVKGFIPFQKWQVMTAEIAYLATQLYALSLIDPFRWEWQVDESRLEWHLNLYDGDTQIGECQSWGIPPEFAACTEYNHWMQIEWLGVEEPYRNRGLGRRLLSTQLHASAWRGKMYCLVYTATDNLPTIKLNKGMGFTSQVEVWGWTWKPD